jgi:hypothetical protein
MGPTGGYTCDTTISLSADWLTFNPTNSDWHERNPTNLDLFLVHEMTHVAQRYGRKAPRYWEEGNMAKNKLSRRTFTRLAAGSALSGAVLVGPLPKEFEPATVQSINVTQSGGDALVFLLIWTGAKINFGIAFVAGIVAGAALVAVLGRDFKLVGFEQPADMLRYAAGAALMGVGGVLALGCTIGNGLTGIASLAPTSFIAVPAMALAAAATMKWRWRTQS